MLTQKCCLPIVALTIAILLIADSARGNEDDARLLQGRWQVVSASTNGSKYSEDRLEKMFVVVEKDELVLHIEGTKTEQGAKLTIDPKAKPRQINFTESKDVAWPGGPSNRLFRSWKFEGDQAVAAEGNVEGIYKLEKDRLTLCWRTIKASEIVDGKVVSRSQVRPTVFRSDLYDHQYLFVLERAKPKN